MEKIQEVSQPIGSTNFPAGFVISYPLREPVELIPGPTIVHQHAASKLLDRLMGLVLNDHTRKIGIYGMGGVGKTTLVRNLNNMLAEGSSSAQPFDIVIWVTVSSITDLHGIQFQIARRLGLRNELRGESKERGTNILLEELKKEKKFLLIMDGVWEKIDLDKVGIPQGEDFLGCKIILTSRSLDVCNQMETNENIRVDGLNDEAGWELFGNYVGDLPDVEEIKSLAREVAQACMGLPPAIKVVGSSMRGKKTVGFWRDALEGLRRSAIIIEPAEEVFLPLKWSYDSLQGKNIQSCLLYCSLFPKDFSIGEGELIQYWRAEGLLDESMNPEESSDTTGVALIEKLKNSCMLEPGNHQGTVKMHDIIREFALWMVSSSKDGSKFFVQSDMGFNKMMIGEGMHDSIKRVSLIGGELSEIPKYLAGCSRLSTLFLQSNPLKKIPKEFFLGLKALRVLNLSGTLIESLPKEVGELSNLRLLNLSWTGALESIEAHTISSLSSLEVLDMYESGYGWNLKGEVDEESATLEELLHLKGLYFLRIRVYSNAHLPLDLDWLKRLTSFQIYIGHNRGDRDWLPLQAGERVVEIDGDVEHLAKCAEGMLSIAIDLDLKGGIINGIWELSKSIQLQCLKSLNIYECQVRKLMIRREDVQHEVLPNLEEISLTAIENVENIWEEMVASGGGRRFPKLRKIAVIHCEGLKSLIPYDFLQELDNLEDIYVRNCSNMEEIFGAKVVDENTPKIVSTNVADRNALPKLRILTLGVLPRLRCICQETFSLPALEMITVERCDDLRRLPFSTGNANKIREIEGEEEWWKKLEWEDDDTKLNLQKYFKASVSHVYPLPRAFLLDNE
ncbi:disease resistance protein At4g27190-like [Tasmannia lanceolata]|uniref:disease resistance protein At4g27190-like n=1 Tax=Tasmannia lanceolata TaxID=3420 RepID=UPI00406315FB